MYLRRYIYLINGLSHGIFQVSSPDPTDAGVPDMLSIRPDFQEAFPAPVVGGARQSPALPRQPVVLAAVDVSDAADEVLNGRIVRMAVETARRRGARLHLAHAVHFVAESILACPVRGIGPKRLAAVRRHVGAERRRRLKELLAGVPGADGFRISVVRGRPGRVIRRLAERLGADVVVMGALTPPPFARVVLGSMVEVVAGQGHSVVLVGRESAATSDGPQREDRV